MPGHQTYPEQSCLARYSDILDTSPQYASGQLYLDQSQENSGNLFTLFKLEIAVRNYRDLL